MRTHIGFHRDKSYYQSLLEQEGQTDRDLIEGADTRANLSEWYEAIIEQEEQDEPEGYETQRMTFKSVSTKKSGKRGKI